MQMNIDTTNVSFDDWVEYFFHNRQYTEYAGYMSRLLNRWLNNPHSISSAEAVMLEAYETATVYRGDYT